MRNPRRLITALGLASALALGMVAPASAAIHEIVASFCSGGNGNVDPGGQVRFGERSFLRALQASGLYSIEFGEAPADAPAPAPGTVPVTIEIDYSRPNSKFVATGGWLVFPVDGLTVYLSAGAPDHPAFDHCPAMAASG